MPDSPAISIHPAPAESYFFVGLGGMGMAPLALYLKGAGHSVCGCDDHPREEVAKLLSDNHIPLLPTQGAVISESPSKPSGEAANSKLGAWSLGLGHSAPAALIPAGTTRVVFSSAVPPSHPVRLAAEARQLPILRRGRLLAEISARHRLVAVVGSHGKTTTTALIVSALASQNFPASHVLGGLFQSAAPSSGSPASPAVPVGSDSSPITHHASLASPSLPPAAFSGGSDWLVAEVDESDGTIEHFCPEITVVVNFDWDHPDQYRTEADLEEAFGRLFSRTRGTVLIPSGDAVLERLSARAPRVLRYGPGGDLQLLSHHPLPNGQQLDLSGQLLKSLPSFQPASDSSLITHHSSLGSTCLAASPTSPASSASTPSFSVTVAAPGPFNRHNSLAALAASVLVTGSVPPPGALASFPGVRRRQNLIFDRPGLTVLEDYAHHPAEIAALLGYARERWPGRRLVTVFQPHRFTRTRQYRAEFAAVLDRADVVVLKETYAASEKPLEGGRAADILALMSHRDASLVPDFATLAATLDRATTSSTVSPASNSSLITDPSSLGSVVLFVGAGDIEDWGHAFARRLSSLENWWASLRTALSSEALLERDAPLGSRTTMGVGGRAAFYAEPASEADLSCLLGSLRPVEMPFFILGRGSNVIVDDAGFQGLVIRLTAPAFCRVENLGQGRVSVGAGVSLKRLTSFATQEGISGFEFMEGIPGTVGGSLRMNAGAMGGWIFDVVAEVRLMTRSGDIHHLPRDRFHVEYRSCPELQDAIALGAVLAGEAASPEAVRSRTAELSARRKASQPRDASAGCAFKNPAGDSAGRLIDSLGLKGRRLGQAEVSVLHANFIVNRGEATAAEVMGLIRDVRSEVLARTGVALEPEVLLLGNDWPRILAQPSTPPKGG